MSEHKVLFVKPAGFWQGAKDSQAIIFTYLPVSFAFGVSATQFGFTPWEALFLSCSMYAGASQFLVVAAHFRRILPLKVDFLVATK